MERSRSRTDPTPQTCEWPGCDDDAPFRAPMSRDRLNQYRWFCLAHVRAYNATWNYYEGMSENEVEADVRRDTVWQRPTWRLGASIGRHAQRPRIHDGFAWFGEDDGEREEPRHHLKNGQAHAFAVLELRPPVTIPILKARYKELVKRHHPDANGGDPAAEERFKEINEAYRTVLEMLQT